ncbi:hypothetical protein [Methanospirillum purgamenti]|nr:hypothetical protein [Methanospirillum hungatei]MDX8550331.1 hypothetical protein [Methanospirillum hungatei]
MRDPESCQCLPYHAMPYHGTTTIHLYPVRLTPDHDTLCGGREDCNTQ